jgi:hypothetical protein
VAGARRSSYRRPRAALSVARAPCTAAALGAVVLLGACGANAGEQKHPPAPAPRPVGGSGRASAPAEGTCHAGPRSVCVTASANGRTIAVGVGRTLAVDLSTPSGIWSGPVELGPRLLRQDGEVRRAGGGVSVAYTAASPGRTELRAFERPLCRPARACPQFILLWELHIRVSKSLP